MNASEKKLKIFQKWKSGILLGFEQPMWRFSSSAGKRVITQASIARFEKELMLVKNPTVIANAFIEFKKTMQNDDLSTVISKWSHLSIKQKQIFSNKPLYLLRSVLRHKATRKKTGRKIDKTQTKIKKVRFSKKVFKKT